MRRAARMAILAAGLLLLLGAAPVLADAPAGDAPIDTVSGLTLDPSLQEIPPRASHRVPGARGMLLGAFALLIVLPFVPGLVEVYRPRDRYPLPIDMHYSKDPRFFGRSARRILADAFDLDGVQPGEHEVVLSKPELIEVRDDAEVPAGESRETLLAARGALRIGAGAVCLSEVFARGDAVVDDDARLRTLSGESNVSLGADVVLDRWVDAEGDVSVGPRTHLGVSAAAGGALGLADDVLFSRLWGAPIHTAGYKGDVDEPVPTVPAPPLVEEIRTIADVADYHDGDLKIGADETRSRPLVVTGDLVLEAGAILAVSARVRGDLTLESDAVVHGDLFVEGNVELAARARVRGNLFSQARASLARGARVGRPGRRKSLIAKLGLELADDVAVHGYVLTDGRGHVSCAGSS